MKKKSAAKSRAPRETTDTRWDHLAQDIVKTLCRRRPILATHLGIHDHDGELPDPSREAVREDIHLAHQWLKRIEAFPTRGLSPDRAVDKAVAAQWCRLELFELETCETWRHRPDAAQTAAYSVLPLFINEFAPLNERLDKIHSRLEKIPHFLERARSRLEEGVTLWVQVAIETCGAVPALFEQIRAAAERSLDHERYQHFYGATLRARTAVQDFADWLRREALPRSKPEFALGPARFKELVKLRELGASPEAIRSYGRKQLKNLKDRLKKLAGKVKPGAKLAEVSKEIRENSPKTFEEALAAVREQVLRSRQWVIDNEFATVPDGESLEVVPTPAFARHLMPFGGYNAPAHFDRVQRGFYWVTPGDAERLKEHNFPSLMNMSVHEGYPGHHLQFVSAHGNPSPIRAAMADGTEFIEGWAHYCEEAVKARGLDNTPAALFVQTQDMIWRAARIVIDVELSSGRMTPAEAVEMLRKETGMDRLAAEAEVKRYTMSPGYQLSYLYGKKLVLELKTWASRKMGKRFTDRFFHDALLRAGSLPLGLMRKELEWRIKEARSKPVAN
ncbi:MAG: hypothetical protein FD180_4070 [Planctomycetota bacterium]|nr:MAG: hypothetical protein FD180_4070 [Planctomycetota bacterium]